MQIGNEFLSRSWKSWLPFVSWLTELAGSTRTRQSRGVRRRRGPADVATAAADARRSRRRMSHRVRERRRGDTARASTTEQSQSDSERETATFPRHYSPALRTNTKQAHNHSERCQTHSRLERSDPSRPAVPHGAARGRAVTRPRR